MLAHVEAVSAEFRERLTELAGRHPDLIAEVRGKGLLIGLKMIPNNREFMAIARDHDLLVAGGGENCVRLLPPLIITSEEIVEAVKRLDAACEDARARLAKAAA
jgi:acetylornithine/N-succinyldiaminopimelate aminotransferase